MSLLADVVARVDMRLHRWLKRHGDVHQGHIEERSNELPDDAPLSSCLRVASAKGSFATVLDPPAAGAAGREEDHFDTCAAPQESKWIATHDGFIEHAGLAVAAGRRTFLERLFRWITSR